MTLTAEEHDFDELDPRGTPAPIAAGEDEDPDEQEAGEEREADWID